MPVKTDYAWNADILRKVILTIREQHADASWDELFIVGISRRGTGALRLADRHGDELPISGMVVCCPENTDALTGALKKTPTYLFHGDGDTVVSLSGPREKEYESLSGRYNFRWTRG